MIASVTMSSTVYPLHEVHADTVFAFYEFICKRTSRGGGEIMRCNFFLSIDDNFNVISCNVKCIINVFKEVSRYLLLTGCFVFIYSYLRAHCGMIKSFLFLIDAHGR